MGNLTRNPELRKTKTGAAVTELGIALNRSWIGENGQRQEETTFVDVTVWGRNAENAAQYLQKGRSVLVEGRLQLETWQDKQSGQDRSKLKIVADAVQFLGAPEGAASTNSADSVPERQENQPAHRASENRRVGFEGEGRTGEGRSSRRHEVA